MNMLEEDWWIYDDDNTSTHNKDRFEKKDDYYNAKTKNKRVRDNSKEIKKLEKELLNLKRNL